MIASARFLVRTRTTRASQTPIGFIVPSDEFANFSTASIYGIGGGNDYTVLDADHVIGRIPVARLTDCNWMWTITARESPRTIHSRGYSATREEAMKDFKTQWAVGRAEAVGNLS